MGVFGFVGLAGCAREDITPPVGIYARNWGAAEHEVADGIHRPLTLTAIALSDETKGSPLVLVSADLGWWRTPEDEWFVRSAALEALGIPEERLLLHLTHTHSGPSICREDADMPGGEHIPPYLERLRDACASACARAVANLRPALLDWSYGVCDLARNRDFPDPASDRFLCGFHPVGESDDALLVGRVSCSQTGAPIATLANYACHPTVLAWENRLISPDYVGALRTTVEAETRGAPCLFLLGASGELQPAESYTGDTAVADRHGRRLGYSVLSALEGMPAPGTDLAYSGAVDSGAPLAVWRQAAGPSSNRLVAQRTTVELPLKELPTIASLKASLASATGRAQAERIRRKIRVRRLLGDATAARVPITTWRVGGAGLVAHRDEAYSYLQRSLRAAHPSRPIVVMNLTSGGHAGYLPPRDLYGRDQYQVWQSPYAEGSLETLTDAAASSLAELFQG